MAVSGHIEALYFREEEVKSYFPDEIWSSMEDYEKNSYRNILNKYYLMKTLGENPNKPYFMTSNNKKASRRKATGNLCPVQTKIQESKTEKSLNKVTPTKVQRTTNKVKKEELRGKDEKTKEESTQLQNKASVLSDDSYKGESISAEMTSSVAHKVCKSDRGIIKGQCRMSKKADCWDIRHQEEVVNQINRDDVFSCDKCSVTYKALLEDHKKKCRSEKVRVAVAHSGVRAHVCYLCDKGFTTASNLKKHLKAHSGQKAFKCSECAYTSCLIHSGDRPYRCDQCSYTATKSHNLTVHQRTHTGRKPYSCKFCSYKATQLHHVARHQKVHNVH